MKEYTHYIIVRHDYPEAHPLFQRRRELLSLTRKSLERQSCQDFELLIIGRREAKTIFRTIRDTTDTPMVITTRLDSDDQLHPQFVRLVQRCFNGKPLLIDSAGYLVNIHTGIASGARWGRMRSPFLTLIEHTRKAKAVYCAKHHQVFRLFPRHRFIKKRLWCHVVHDASKTYERSARFCRSGKNSVPVPGWFLMP